MGVTGVGSAGIVASPDLPEPGHFKVPYHGRFSELPVGSVQPRGWIQAWLERQAQGLTGHPENMSYPYDTCMYAGIIPPPPRKDKYWKEWWPYEQSAYFVDATTRLNWLIQDDAISQRRDANLNYILVHSSGTNLGGSHACWPNAVVGRALMADGGIVSSEHLEPAAFYSVHESCDLTDWSWSLGYMFMAAGEARFADLIERTTFNALPGAVTKDFKQLQYFSAVNQLVIAATNSHTPRWPTRMTYRAAHDTECCAGNINRAMPNYVIRMWMRPQDGGLAAVYYGPSEVTATVGGQKVTVTEETDYPFRDTISFRVATAGAIRMNFQFRIPGWCSNATMQLNGQALPATLAAGRFAALEREFHGGDTVKLKLPMPVRVEHWFHSQSVCLTRGPLVYSLKITEQRVEHTSDPAAIKPFLLGREIRGFSEVEFLPASDWRYGFDEALERNMSEIKVVESGMTGNPFLADQTPVRLELPLCRLSSWTANGESEPAGLPTAAQTKTVGQPATMTLVPYGATHLRLTTLPLISDGSSLKK